MNIVTKFTGDILNKRQKPKKYLLWVDDIRPIPNEYLMKYHTSIAKTYDEAIHELHRFRYNVICLDHDLGNDKTGYDICKYIVENHIWCDEFRIHTQNPVGRQNMVQLLQRYTNAVIKII